MTIYLYKNIFCILCVQLYTDFTEILPKPRKKKDDYQKRTSLLENCGLNVEDKNQNGNTPLMYASISGHFQIIKYLIEKFNAKVTDSIIDNINKNSSCFDPAPKEEIKSYLLKHKK